jgi:DNA-binding MarR family transcriptional regulator
MNSETTSTEIVLTSFRHHLRILEREVIRELEAQTTCCGVTVAQCHVLLELSTSTLSLTGLSGALGLDPSTLSRTVDGLVKAGLVERTEDPSDRRSLRLALTAAGTAKVAYIDDTCNRYYAELLAGLTEEDREHVLRGVAVMAERMRGWQGTVPECTSCAADGGLAGNAV